MVGNGAIVSTFCWLSLVVEDTALLCPGARSCLSLWMLAAVLHSPVDVAAAVEIEAEVVGAAARRQARIGVRDSIEDMATMIELCSCRNRPSASENTNGEQLNHHTN